MAIFDKFLNSVRLADDDYDEDYDYEDELDEEEEESSKKRFFGLGKKKKQEQDEEEAPVEKSIRGKITPMRGGKSAQHMEVCVMCPTKFEDVQEMADVLLSSRPVILNMEGLPTDLVLRILDFMYGACYSIDGSVKQISNYIFIISPAFVEISGDYQGLVSAFNSTTNNLSAMSQLRASGGGISSY